MLYSVLFNFSAKVVAVGGGAAVAIVAAPAAASALGFMLAGIKAGTTAAWMMSLYGGAVTKGSVVALLQSTGATGAIGSVATVVVGTAGGIVGLIMSNIFTGSSNNANDEKKK